jgi:hypothetical protein
VQWLVEARETKSVMSSEVEVSGQWGQLYQAFQLALAVARATRAPL